MTKKIDSNLRKVLVNGKFIANVNKQCEFYLNDGINNICVKGNIVNLAVNNPTSKEEIISKLNKLGDTVYRYDKLEIGIDNNIFIPLSELNQLRRQAIQELNDKRLYQIAFVKSEYKIDVPDFKKERLLTCFVENKKQYDKLGKHYDIVYAEEKIDNCILKLPRVINKYPDVINEVMIGEIGGLNKYKGCDTDFSLNVVNSYTVAFLHSLGVKRITLSYELNDNQIDDLIRTYYERYGKHPNLELIVSGYEEVMISKFSLNKYYKKEGLFLKDMLGNKFRIKDKNDYMFIYNYRKRNNFDNKYYDIGINSLRFNLDN